MPVRILLPALSPTMEEGNLVAWHKKEGDSIKPGDVLFDVETDKATMEVEARESGTLARIIVNDGAENVAVNTPVALMLKAGESKEALEDFPLAAPGSEKEAEVPTQTLAQTVAQTQRTCDS